MRRALFLLGLGLGLIALGAAVSGGGRSRAPSTHDGESGVLSGICEASAVVPWEGGFLVGDNEGEDRLYAFDADLQPRDPVALPERVEDIEALALLPAGLWVVGSQSNNKNGELRPDRSRTLILGHLPVIPDLSACAPCEAVRSLAPKRGGLSVEGAATWRGGLWVGLRSPLAEKAALLLRLDGDATAALRVVEMVKIDLGGRGVRDLLVSGDDLLILAGPLGESAEPHVLFRLGAPEQAPQKVLDLPPHAEGMAPTPDGRLLVVMDGDGGPGKTCTVPATWARLELPAGPG